MAAAARRQRAVSSASARESARAVEAAAMVGRGAARGGMGVAISALGGGLPQEYSTRGCCQLVKQESIPHHKTSRI